MIEEKDYLTEYNLNLNESPHYKNARQSRQIMLHVNIALLFPTLAACYFFHWQRVLLMVTVGIGSAILFEYLYQKLRHEPIKVQDGSAAVTGHLLALSLPTTAPLWTLLLGTAFAILVVKQLGGGMGHNRFNPAASARVMQKIFLTPWITNWILPGPDAISTATPLEYIGFFSRTVPAEVSSLSDLFFGFNLGGPMGETSAFAILLAFIYLVGFQIIRARIPLIFLGTLTLSAFLWSGFDVHFALTHLLSGTAVFGAIFMVTDYSSSPITPRGHEFASCLTGLLCFILRIFLDLPGGFGIALIIVNFLSPWIDKNFAPRIYGHQEAPKVQAYRELK